MSGVINSDLTLTAKTTEKHQSQNQAGVKQPQNPTSINPGSMTHKT